MFETVTESDVREQSSMTYWWPTLQSLDVPTPETVRVEPTPTEIDDGAPATDGTTTVSLADAADVREAVEAVGGPPAFLRSDQMSSKHRMADGSWIRSVDDEQLEKSIGTVFSTNRAAMGVPNPEAYYVREWLDLKYEFEAFDYTPIASEVRVFVHDGSIHDYGFYWPHEAIAEREGFHTPELVEDWRTDLTRLREHALDCFGSIEEYAERVAWAFDGYWSVDFAETSDGDWYAIDMARGEMSWHPENIEKPEEVLEDG